MTASPSTKSVAKRPIELHPITGKVMNADDRETFHDMWDHVSGRACRDYKPVGFMVNALRTDKGLKKYGKKIADKVVIAFNMGVQLGGRAVVYEWTRAHRASMLAYALTGQTDPSLQHEDGGITLKTPKGNNGRTRSTASAARGSEPASDGAADEKWWSPGRFKTRPAWYVGQPGYGVSQIQFDVRKAEDWAWLIQQVRQLRSMYEARTGRELPEGAWPWWEDMPEGVPTLGDEP